MKTRWVLLEKGERALCGDRIHDWNSNAFSSVGDDLEKPDTDAFIVGKGDHVVRKIAISEKALRKAKLDKRTNP